MVYWNYVIYFGNRINNTVANQIA